jgi:uncharacterized protein (TIGR03437 family)
MKRVLVFVFLLSSLASSVSSVSSVSSHGSADVSLTWIGQSGFLVETEKGPKVISDPPSNNLGFLFPTTPADVVTVSHIHGDHTNIAAVQGTPALIDGRDAAERQEIPAAGMNFVVIPGFHDINGATRNSIVTWTQGGIRFAQFGDYGQATLTEAQLNDLRDVDVAFIAVSTPTTPPERMKDLIDQLQPRIAILSHFRMPLGGAAVTLPFPDIIAPFTELVYKPTSVTLNRDRLPKTPEIWVMQPIANTVTANAASQALGIPVAPGSLANLSGDFTNAATAFSRSAPLPTVLGNVEVIVGGQAVPLLYVSPARINFQVPGQLETPGQALAEVRVDGTTVGRAQVTTLPGAPGIFSATDRYHRPISAFSPAQRGDSITIWATGHGELSEIVPDGQPAPLNASITTREQPIVTIGGINAEVSFSGLAPGLVGVWQIKAVVPANAPAGPWVPLVVRQGLTSNTLPIAIRVKRRGRD